MKGEDITKNKKTNSKSLLSEVYKGPKYAGKHIIIIKGKIYATKTGQAKTELLEKLLKKSPKEVPTITYIPAEDLLS